MFVENMLIDVDNLAFSVENVLDSQLINQESS